MSVFLGANGISAAIASTSYRSFQKVEDLSRRFPRSLILNARYPLSLSLTKRVSDASSRKPQRLGLRLLQPLCDNTKNRRAHYYVASESLWLKGASVIFTLLARRVGCIFNILDKFNPGARQLINAGKAYLKALHAQKCAGDVECGQEGDSDPGVEEAARERVQG
ncbi:hypothetical protein G5I_13744 [Acromyrmex echinatior]|uniref:Uncharacterized protein n=1 Tax=Acromyrmex echinatior TaxID=103372 RepID=F4X5V3_ACREC|nr:hypothetical protein G5I_13744 [Acromyrmex echinatior]